MFYSTFPVSLSFIKSVSALYMLRKYLSFIVLYVMLLFFLVSFKLKQTAILQVVQRPNFWNISRSFSNAIIHTYIYIYIYTPAEWALGFCLRSGTRISDQGGGMSFSGRSHLWYYHDVKWGICCVCDWNSCHYITGLYIRFVHFVLTLPGEVCRLKSLNL